VRILVHGCPSGAVIAACWLFLITARYLKRKVNFAVFHVILVTILSFHFKALVTIELLTTVAVAYHGGCWGT